ncbi:MAG: hypothetical protein JXA68_01695 [Ignavibacteriales bacterium]|nr:hypothetical protein [Ignavibacteriales bacterium]
MKSKFLFAILFLTIFAFACNNKEETEEEKLKREIAELKEQLEEKDEEIIDKKTQKENIENQIEDMTKLKDGEDAMFNPEYIISSSKAGKVNIGIEISKLYDLYPSNRIKKSSMMMEGDKYEVYEIYDNSNNLLFIVEPWCEDKCTVFRAIIKSPKMKTNKEIGIGSTVEQLKEKYKVEEIVLVEAYVVATVENINITFVLDPSKIPDSWYRNPRMDKIPHDTKIIEMFVY